MMTQAIRRAIAPATYRESIHDVLIVSSFGLWALLLGLAPVLVLDLLMRS
jgi:hypothetical protein